MALPIASLFFLSNIWGLPEKVQLAISHQIVPSDSFGDEDISVNIRVSNRNSDPLGNVEVDEHLPSEIKVESGASRVLTQLGPRDHVELALTFHSPIRGHYWVGPLVARVQDPLGFYLAENIVEPEILSIMPKPERIRGAELRPRHLGPWPGTIPARTLGPGTMFYSLRDYVSGDDPKRINWKSSARHGRLIVNEMEAERVTDVMIVLDTDVSYYETAGAGYSILVLSPSPKAPAIFESEIEEIAYRMLMLERSNTLLALEKICTVAQWSAGVPLSTILAGVRRQRLVIRV